MDLECLHEPEICRLEPGADVVAPPKDRAPAFAAEFVEDITVPDYTVIAVGTTIRKVWRLLNVGTDAWTNCTIVAVSSLEHRLGPVETTLDIPYCLGGCWCDVVIDFHVPAITPMGFIESKWHLYSGDGERFDSEYCRDLFMIVEVVPE